MDVGRHDAVAAHLVTGEARNLDVFANPGNGGDALRLQRRQGRVGGELAGDFLAKGAKGLIAGHEIGFAIDLGQHAQARPALDILGNDAFPGYARGLLGGGGAASLAQYIDGGVQVALGLRQGLFAIHQACASGFAQLAYVGGGKFSHLSLSIL